MELRIEGKGILHSRSTHVTTQTHRRPRQPSQNQKHKQQCRKETRQDQEKDGDGAATVNVRKDETATMKKDQGIKDQTKREEDLAVVGTRIGPGGGSTIASLIQRFRNDPPKSAEERQRSMELQREAFWWKKQKNDVVVEFVQQEQEEDQSYSEYASEATKILERRTDLIFEEEQAKEEAFSSPESAEEEEQEVGAAEEDEEEDNLEDDIVALNRKADEILKRHQKLLVEEPQDERSFLDYSWVSDDEDLLGVNDTISRRLSLDYSDSTILDGLALLDDVSPKHTTKPDAGECIGFGCDGLDMLPTPTTPKSFSNESPLQSHVHLYLHVDSGYVSVQGQKQPQQQQDNTEIELISPLYFEEETETRVDTETEAMATIVQTEQTTIIQTKQGNEEEEGRSESKMKTQEGFFKPIPLIERSPWLSPIMEETDVPLSPPTELSLEGLSSPPLVPNAELLPSWSSNETNTTGFSSEQGAFDLSPTSPHVKPMEELAFIDLEASLFHLDPIRPPANEQSQNYQTQQQFINANEQQQQPRTELFESAAPTVTLNENDEEQEPSDTQPMETVEMENSPVGENTDVENIEEVLENKHMIETEVENATVEKNSVENVMEDTISDDVMENTLVDGEMVENAMQQDTVTLPEKFEIYYSTKETATEDPERRDASTSPVQVEVSLDDLIAADPLCNALKARLQDLRQQLDQVMEKERQLLGK